MQAYADSHLPTGWTHTSPEYLQAMRDRNLQFNSGEWVSPATAMEILQEAIPNGYNEFHPDLLQAFPDDALVCIAREYSVCLYVKGNALPSKQSIIADEQDVQDDGSVRYWWD